MGIVSDGVGVQNRVFVTFLTYSYFEKYGNSLIVVHKTRVFLSLMPKTKNYHEYAYAKIDFRTSSIKSCLTILIETASSSSSWSKKRCTYNREIYVVINDFHPSQPSSNYSFGGSFVDRLMLWSISTLSGNFRKTFFTLQINASTFGKLPLICSQIRCRPCARQATYVGNFLK